MWWDVVEDVLGDFDGNGHHLVAEVGVLVHPGGDGNQKAGDAGHDVLAGEPDAEDLLGVATAQRRCGGAEPGGVAEQRPVVW